MTRLPYFIRSKYFLVSLICSLLIKQSYSTSHSKKIFNSNTPKLDSLLSIVERTSKTNLDSCILNFDLARKIALQKRDFDSYKQLIRIINKGLNRFGKNRYRLKLIHNAQKELDSLYPNISIENNKEAINFKIFCIRTEAATQSNFGNYTNTFDLYYKGLKLAEKYTDSIEIANILNDLSITHYRIKDYKKTIEFAEKAYSIYLKIKDYKGAGSSLMTIGLAYSDIPNYLLSLKYYNQTDSIYSFLNIDKMTLRINRAFVLRKLGYTDLALNEYLAGLDTFKLRGEKSWVALLEINTGDFLTDLKQYNRAKSHIEKGIALSKELQSKKYLADGYEYLTKLYDSIKNEKLAYKSYRLFILYRDSTLNSEISETALNNELKFEFQKKTVTDSLLNISTLKEKQILHETEIQRQKIYTYVGIAGFVIMLIITIVSIKIIQDKRKANNIISEQKNIALDQKRIIEEKQKEIIDSIYYAKRIQNSLLSKDIYIDKNLKRLSKKTI